MRRLTISLTDRPHRALKDAAMRQSRSMGAVIEESLVLSGILPSDAARGVVARARASAGLSDEDAMATAVRETRLHRKGRGDDGQRSSGQVTS